MKSVFKEKSENSYVCVTTILLPFVDLVSGIPKHIHNSKKYYKSAMFNLLVSLFYTYVCVLPIPYLIFEDFKITMIVSPVIIFCMTMVNSIRRLMFFNDKKYTVVVIKYLVFSFMISILLIALGITLVEFSGM